MKPDLLSTRLPPSLRSLPLDAPWKGNFLATLRRLSAMDPQNPIPGSALSPAEENFRLSQAVSLAFPASEIASLSWQDQQLAIKLFSLGVWGPQGALPLHFSELAFTRAQQQDTALIDFIDLFHHRSMAIFFRAWHAAQDTASLDRPQHDRFSHYLRCLSGGSPSTAFESDLRQHKQLSAGLHLARKTCAPQDLCATLEAWFHLPFKIEEFQPEWIMVTPEGQSRLHNLAYGQRLADGTILGDACYQVNHKFKVWCGPLTYEQYVSLHPQQDSLARLDEAIQRLTGGYYHYDLQLVLAKNTVPPLTLSGELQLGFDTWLLNEESHSPRLGMIVESRLYTI
ncbi:type VI secretion system baseplate subunit TssG [Rosenbergiella australiborealis]|uniref:Type VI secretion system baseplate subunit TssG n=1 Tax=Rosenbergiella australiborealis TaxID=1544696 RepID=A0ABS5T6N5_9GAMM|nr:type VI secretion system baseplate subunit TssG [Rosenbergiella australiborealis]